MENNKTWLLVADASKARIFSMHKARILIEQNPNNLELIGNYTHEASRKKGSDLITDKMGEFGSGTFVEATPPKTHEAEVFALELLKHLERGRMKQHFRDVIIVAPPPFMKLLNKHMPHTMHKLISQSIEKDYTQHNERELVKNLADHF